MGSWCTQAQAEEHRPLSLERKRARVVFKNTWEARFWGLHPKFQYFGKLKQEDCSDFEPSPGHTLRLFVLMYELGWYSKHVVPKMASMLVARHTFIVLTVDTKFSHPWLPNRHNIHCCLHHPYVIVCYGNRRKLTQMAYVSESCRRRRRRRGRKEKGEVMKRMVCASQSLSQQFSTCGSAPIFCWTTLLHGSS